MNTDQVTGRVEEAKGKVKEVAGNLVGNKTLEIKGKVQQVAGKLQAGLGDLRSEITNVLKSDTATDVKKA